MDSKVLFDIFCCVQVWQVGSFGSDAKLNPQEVLMLMLTMTAKELAVVVSNMFRAFGEEGGRLKTDAFLKLITLLSQWDSSLTTQRCDDLKQSVSGSEILVFRDVKEHAALQDQMAAPQES